MEEKILETKFDLKTAMFGFCFLKHHVLMAVVSKLFFFSNCRPLKMMIIILDLSSTQLYFFGINKNSSHNSETLHQGFPKFFTLLPSCLPGRVSSNPSTFFSLVWFLCHLLLPFLSSLLYII